MTKKLYKNTIEDRQGTFAHFETSVQGLLHREAEHFCEAHSYQHSSQMGKRVHLSELGFYLPWFEHQSCVYGSREEWTRV